MWRPARLLRRPCRAFSMTGKPGARAVPAARDQVQESAAAGDVIATGYAPVDVGDETRFDESILQATLPVEPDNAPLGELVFEDDLPN